MPYTYKVAKTKTIFTGLRFEVEQATRGLSAIAELLVIISRRRLQMDGLS